ncbi:putative Holliday junction resolvase [Thermoflavifilum aggregans]|uniref:Putative pre-16S rRNA nuclease n=1 Tax=Thermoflavifilum aggregans TaxID=454188 RepID=A0A2M9CWS9_9BACT|nr:Holliday junction resolvase RuvX [Thermoflavifilum aggregans]MBX6380104.1 Holliday junction resolvase RuvX [Thermoflavifilum aggregans]PJJ76337.1 putative Holliday junction resolvase [Thermoflavifilum aggregans]
MGRILAIDYGKKRTGLAVSDPLKMIATGLTTVASHALIPFLKDYTRKEPVEKIIIGLPLDLQGRDTDATPLVREMIRILHKHFPDIPVEAVDERFTSQLASRTLVESGLKKKARQNKALVDEVSATILLQGYLQSVL